MNFAYDTTADEVSIGDKIRVNVDPYWTPEITEGIVVDMGTSYGDPCSRVHFTLWSWEGTEDISVWDVDPVTIFPKVTAKR